MPSLGIYNGFQKACRHDNITSLCRHFKSRHGCLWNDDQALFRCKSSAIGSLHTDNFVTNHLQTQHLCTLQRRIFHRNRDVISITHKVGSGHYTAAQSKKCNQKGLYGFHVIIHYVSYAKIK